MITIMDVALIHGIYRYEDLSNTSIVKEYVTGTAYLSKVCRI